MQITACEHATRSGVAQENAATYCNATQNTCVYMQSNQVRAWVSGRSTVDRHALAGGCAGFKYQLVVLY